MRIYSIFRSIDGEVNHYHQGGFATFIRASGCNLRCSYCDTKYAWEMSEGNELTVEEIYGAVHELGCKKVTITGGEPLLQPQSMLDLTRLLHHNGYRITVETNGSMPLVGFVDYWVVDYKLSSSGQSDQMRPRSFEYLRKGDFVKFVVTDFADFREGVVVRETLKERGCGARFAWSPNFDVLNTTDLLDWMSGEGLFDDVLNVQLHKLLPLKEPD